MNKEKDISIIEWYPLPAPDERYVLVRFHNDGELYSETAFSVDGINFRGDTGHPFYAPVEAWAYFPYDEPSPPSRVERLVIEKLEKMATEE